MVIHILIREKWHACDRAISKIFGNFHPGMLVSDQDAEALLREATMFPWEQSRVNAPRAIGFGAREW